MFLLFFRYSSTPFKYSRIVARSARPINVMDKLLISASLKSMLRNDTQMGPSGRESDKPAGSWATKCFYTVCSFFRVIFSRSFNQRTNMSNLNGFWHNISKLLVEVCDQTAIDGRIFELPGELNGERYATLEFKWIIYGKSIEWQREKYMNYSLDPEMHCFGTQKCSYCLRFINVNWFIAEPTFLLCS